MYLQSLFILGDLLNTIPCFNFFRTFAVNYIRDPPPPLFFLPGSPGPSGLFFHYSASRPGWAPPAQAHRPSCAHSFLRTSPTQGGATPAPAAELGSCSPPLCEVCCPGEVSPPRFRWGPLATLFRSHTACCMLPPQAWALIVLALRFARKCL